MTTVLLLICSNIFMTAAWYGHLKFRHTSLLAVIVVSWLIALPEYALQVPANRIGYRQFSEAQLKIIQEVITISVFLIFNLCYFGKLPKWNEALAMALIVSAVGAMLFPQLIAQRGGS